MKTQYVILYAEDEKQTRNNHIEYLKNKYDCIIFEASDGLEALSLYKKHSPDIVLTDITMPKMNGLELIKEIRKISQQTKIIILTAHSEQTKLLEAINMNVVNYLIKPINRKKLSDAVEIAMQTLPSKLVEKDNIYLSENDKFNSSKCEHLLKENEIKLTKSESTLLELLCKHKNREIDSYAIFIHIWNDFEKEFKMDSVRTLVKKLRRKLPEGVLENIYGGYYKLNVK